MVFREFDRARTEAAQEVNIFLNKTWGIEHYERLAPAALLLRVPGYKAFTVFPLLLEEGDSEGWVARVLGESTDEIQVSGGNGRGDLKLWIGEERLSGLEHDYTRRNLEIGFDQELFTSTEQISSDDEIEEGFKSFLIESFPPGKGVTLQVFGTFIEPHSGTRLNFYAADAREPAVQFTSDHRFKLASWLKERFADATAVRSDSEEVAHPNKEEGEGQQPDGQGEGESEIPF